MVNDTTAQPQSPWHRRLKVIGGVILLVGLVAAGVVYRLGTQANAYTNDMSMVGYQRAQTQQMGVMYGKMGSAIEDFSSDLRQPGTQATIIVVVSVIVALGCFHFSRPLDEDTEAEQK